MHDDDWLPNSVSIWIYCTNFGGQDFFNEINTFIQQGHMKLFKSDCEDIYNVTKDFYFK